MSVAAPTFAGDEGRELSFVRDTETILIAHDGHLIGSRPWRGGRAFFFQPPHGGDVIEVPLQQISLFVGDTLFAALVVFAPPEAVKSGIVPAPFDKWCVGEAVLPPIQARA